jgi:hypothetical protein
MTLTVNSNNITIDFLLGETIEYTFNCGDTVSLITVGTTHAINNPEQGIYCFTGVSGSSIYKESVYFDSGLKCEFITKIKETEEYEKYYIYEAMILALDCNDCNCELACWFYDQLINYISDDCC